MTIRGLLNCHIDGRSRNLINNVGAGDVARTSQDYFLAIYNFLNSSVAQSLGIQRVALYNGVGRQITESLVSNQAKADAGPSMRYWDEGKDIAGNNSWAVFAFTSASNPFYVSIQFAGRGEASAPTIGGTAASAPAVLQGSLGTTESYGVGISVSFNRDGTSPYGGTTNNNGSDSKGSSTWISGSICFPRCNSPTGDRSSLRDGYMTLMQECYVSPKAVNSRSPARMGLDGSISSNDSADCMMHMLISENDIFIATDSTGRGDYHIFYFGKIRSKSDIHYVCLQAYNEFDSFNNDILLLDPKYYGGRDIGTKQVPSGTWYAGGGIPDYITNQSYSFIIDGTNLMLSESFSTPSNNMPTPLRHPNRAMSDPSGQLPGKFDLLNIPINIAEDNPYYKYGHHGEIDFFKMCYGLPSNSTVNNKQWAILGTSIKNSIKIAIPWDGTSSPGLVRGRREGTIM